MGSLRRLLAETDEMAIAKNVGIPHDEARMRFSLNGNTVDDFQSFIETITDYYIHHMGYCMVTGGFYARREATGHAKELLDKEYRRHGGDLVSAYNDGHDGTNGGLRIVLDKMAERIKTQSVERYLQDAFDRHVAPNSWSDKVEIMRQFISQCGHQLSSSIQTDQPERYAHAYKDLIKTYVESLRQSSSIFRRL